MTEQTHLLQGKVAIVTGAGRGIGKAIAVSYAREGAAVSCAARTASDIEATAREIEEAGGRGLAVRTDITDLDSVLDMFESTVERFGGLDILVNNAGGNYDRSRVEDGDPADWLATLNLNLVGAYYCAKTAIPYLKRRGAGKIIMVGSGIGHKGNAGSSAYSCSKAGLWMLTRVLAQELWQYEISVNELIPGPVMTERAREAYGRREGTVFDIDSEWTKGPRGRGAAGTVPGHAAGCGPDGPELQPDAQGHVDRLCPPGGETSRTRGGLSQRRLAGQNSRKGRPQGLADLHSGWWNPLGALRHTRAPCELGSHGLLEYVDNIAVAPDV